MPGIRHVVTLTFNDDISEAQLAAVVDGLRGLPAVIDEIERYEVGTDVGRSAGNASLAIVADFASWPDYEAYRDHPVHQALGHDVILPLLAGRSAVQHERR